MNKPVIAIKLSQSDYQPMVDLGNRVISSMTGNASFATPAPTLLALQTAVTNVENALALRGDVHNHGTTSDMSDLRSKAITLHQLLTAEADYVMTTVQIASGNNYPDMAALIDTSGFSRKGEKNPQGLLGPVRNLRRVLSPELNLNQVKGKFTRPEGVTSRTNVKSNIIFRSATPVFSTAVQIQTVSKNEFIDTNDTGAAVVWYYWVVAVSAAGPGAVSDVLMVSLAAI